MSNENFAPAAKRLRRKLEVMRLDFKASNNNRKYDIEECLQLLAIMEKTANETTKGSPADKTDLGAVSGGAPGH